MEFYIMGNNTSKSKQWSYAPRFYPIDGVVEKRCSTCGSVEKYPIGKFAIDLEGGTKYPDILLCGQYPLLIVSEKVINDWGSEEFKGYKYFPIEIRNIDSKALKDKPPLKYYSVEVTSNCELDFHSMDVNIVDTCNECGKVKFSKQIWEINTFVVNRNSWTGTELFVSSLFPRKIIVSKDVVRCSCKNKHTNFKFLHEKDCLNVFAQAIDIKVLCKKLI